MPEEAILMVLLYALYILVVSQRSKRLKYNVDKKDGKKNPIEDEIKIRLEGEIKPHYLNKLAKKIFSYIIPKPTKHYRLSFLVSVAVIAILSYVMVDAAVGFANILHIPSVII